MKRKIISWCIILIIGQFYICSNLFASEFTLKYSEDFSSNPDLITNDPINCYWDESNGYYHAWMSNTGTSFAVKEIEWSGNSFIMEWDVRINSVQWSAGATFGIFDSQFLYGTNSIVGDYSLVDGGYGRALRVNNGIDDANDYSYTNPWQTGTWYKNIITYDSLTNEIMMASYDRDSMMLIETFNVFMGFFPEGIDYIGLSRLNMEGYTSNAVDLDIDNISFYEAPIPGAVWLLISGIIGIAGFRKRFGKK